MILFAGQQWRQRDRLMDMGSGEEEREGGTNGESSMEM